MKEFKITPIRNGTVIDHITPGCALKVLKILGIMDAGAESIVSVVMNVTGGKDETKDIIKIEDRALKRKEVDKIALIAPNATINIIEEFNVKKKFKVKLGKEVRGIVKCENLNCITNKNEPVESRFTVVSKKPVVLICYYCERDLGDIMQGMV